MQAKSRFIPQRRSSELTKKIMTLTSVHEQKDLKRNVYATNRVKSSNKNLLYIVDAVNEAISRKCKITFRYTDYSPAKRKILRNDGDTVKVKLECSNHLMKYVVDRFGEKVKTEIATEDTFFAYPEVALSPNFYIWIFKFAGEVRIISPDKAVSEISTMAQKMIIAESV